VASISKKLTGCTVDEGGRLALSGSMSLDGKSHRIRVVWEREADQAANRR